MDLVKENVTASVGTQEYNVIVGLMETILERNKVNPEISKALLDWRTRPLIMDRTYLVSDLLIKYGVPPTTELVEDLLKWKGTTDATLRQARYISDVKCSASAVLPNYSDLMARQDSVNAMLKLG